MRERAVTLTLPLAPEEVLARLASATPPSYDDPAGLSVTPADDAGHHGGSLTVRGSRARWTHQVATAADSLTWHQVEGDFTALRVTWTVAPDETPATSSVRIGVDLRTCVPHLAGAVDAAASRALLRALVARTGALAGVPADAVVVTRGASRLADPVLTPTHATHATTHDSQETHHAA